MTYLEQADKALENSKISGARKLLVLHFKEDDYNKWLQDRQEEYDSLYKTVEVSVDEVLNEEGEVQQEAYTYFDYVVDKPTFDEWLNETIIVSEAVYDEEGLLVSPEVIEQVRPYDEILLDEVEVLIDEYLNSSILYQEYLKEQKEVKKEEIIIEHNTVPYEGDFGSINYMSAFLAVANFKYIQAISSGMSNEEAYQLIYKDILTPWKNANNIISEVQAESIAEALEKAMREVAIIIGAE